MVEASSNTCWEDRAISSDREARKALSHRGSGGENIAQHEQWFHGDHVGPPRVADAGAVFLPRSLLGVGGDSFIKKHHMFRGQFVLFLTMQANVLSWCPAQVFVHAGVRKLEFGQVQKFTFYFVLGAWFGVVLVGCRGKVMMCGNDWSAPCLKKTHEK